MAEVVRAPALDRAAHGQGAGVVLPRGDSTAWTGRREDGRYVDRRTTLPLSTVAQLAAVVRAPAFDPAAAGHSAGVGAPRGDGTDPAAEPANVDRRSTVRIRPVAQLAAVVRAPALDRAAHGQGAGIAASRSDGTHPAAEPGNVDRRSTVRIRPVAQLADRVRAPAFDPAAAGHSAGVVVPRGDGADPAAEPANVDRGKAVRLCPLSQFAAVVVAPAFDPAAAGHGAGVAPARGDGADPDAEPANVDRRSTVRIRPVAQLAAVVRAPALDPAAAGQRAGVYASHGDGSDPAAEPANVDRGEPFNLRPVAQ